MRRTKSEPIGDLLRAFLRQQGLESPLNEYRLVQGWAEVVGPIVNRYTRDVYIRNQTLYVRLVSPALKQDLMMLRKNYIERLNTYVGAQVITDIVYI